MMQGVAHIFSLVCRSTGIARARIRHAWTQHLAAWLVCVVMVCAMGMPAQAQAVRGEATLSKPGNFARLIVKLSDDVESDVKMSGSIVIIKFKRPVSLNLARLAEGAPDFVSTARLDPDGGALRIALKRNVTINTMFAGERTFIDFLPENWSGLPPGLPQDVVQELADRARAAERQLRLSRAAQETKKIPNIRVRIANQPTFARYLFEVPDNYKVTHDVTQDQMVLNFDRPLTFDLADAKANAPASVAAIDQKKDDDASQVVFSLVGDVSITTFRDDNAFVVDVAFQGENKIPDASQKLTAPAKSSQTPEAKSVAKLAAHAPAEKPAPPAQTPPSASAPAKPVAEANGQAARAPHDESKPDATKLEAPKRDEAKAAMPAPIAAPPPAPASPPVLPSSAHADAPPATQVQSASQQQGAPSPTGASSVNPANASAGEVAIRVERHVSGTRIVFPFKTAPPAAIFRRAESLWLVFDTPSSFNIDALRGESAKAIRDVQIVPLPQAQALRLGLARPLLASVESDGTHWTIVLADSLANSSHPLNVTRNIADPARASLSIDINKPARLHTLNDPEAGDTLFVVTAAMPVRGFLKRQDFVDLRVLQSAHGIVVQPISDQIAVELASDKVTIGRVGGLTLSAAQLTSDRAAAPVNALFDLKQWRADVEKRFVDHQDEMVRTIAMAKPEMRAEERLKLARFYFAKGFYAEAKAVLDMTMSETKQGNEDVTTIVLHALANILIDRPEDGLKDLASPAIGNSYDAQLWQALAYTRQQRWADAREKFKNVEFAIAGLPIELQRIAVKDAMRAALEVRDYATAENRLNEMGIVGITPEIKYEMMVLRGRLSLALGRISDALRDFEEASASDDRAASAEARMLMVEAKLKRNEIKKDDALAELETVSAIWRGDDIEIHTLNLLTQLYADLGRYRDALLAARTATIMQPNSEISRATQDKAAALFMDLFLEGGADKMPVVDALALFFEFRQLTPIGRRGDEMIRRLAERMVSVDLLDQASELLQYQVDHRLQGAARAQVSARLALVYLMNRKPERALAVLHKSRIGDLAGELRIQRLLIEARAQSDVGRHELALDILSGLNGREALRVRADILWASRRWREASEQIELMYGDRWREFQPLDASEKADILRAAIGYSLADDVIGLSRFKEKYGPKMSEPDDRKAFDAATRAASGMADIGEIAKMAASVDTMQGFLREMKRRFPESYARMMPDAAAKDAADKNTMNKNDGAKAPSVPPKPANDNKGEPATTGSISNDLPPLPSFKRVPRQM